MLGVLAVKPLLPIQVYTIGDAWNFSSIAPIILSRDFSIKTLTEV